jgi:leucyl aminopeptidase
LQAICGVQVLGSWSDTGPAQSRPIRRKLEPPVKLHRVILPALVAVLLPGSVAPAQGGDHQHAAQELTAIGREDDPMTPVHLVTSPRLYRLGIQAMASSAIRRRDGLGNELVIAEIRAHQLEDVSRLIHESEKRCGGYFAFASRSEAEAFIRSDRSAQAMQVQALASYTIDNQAVVGRWLPQVSEANIRGTISQLSTGFPNRYFASNHGRNSAHWIRDTWLALGRGRADVSAELFGCASCSTQPSVILTVRGSELPNEIVVLGGHLDSISSTGTGDAMNAPGADDDASGIATLTEVIRIALANGWKPKRTVKFMGYAAEEVGLRGSQAIAQNFRSRNLNVVGALQLDMTNYAAGTTLDMRLVTDYSNPAMQQFVTDLFDVYLAPSGMTRGTSSCGYACSDHASWTAAGYPAAFMIEPTLFPWLHTPLDNLQEIGGNAAVSVNFARLALAFVGELGKNGRAVASDFDGDQASDLFWRHGQTGANAIWRSGNSALAQKVTTVADKAWAAVGSGDFNGDGKADVFWRNTIIGANSIWRSANSATPQTTAAVTSLAWKVSGLGDFNGDGKADVFWHNTSSGANTIWLSANNATQQATPSAAIAWQPVGLGDFNGDGKADILWRNNLTGANVLWRSGLYSQGQSVTGVTNLAWKVAGNGDFNGDGTADILWRNASTGVNSIWLSANSATQQGIATVPDQNWKIAAVGDYNGDGKSDVLWRHDDTGTNSLWYSGNPTTQILPARVPDLNWKIVP